MGKSSRRHACREGRITNKSGKNNIGQKLHIGRQHAERVIQIQAEHRRDGAHVALVEQAPEHRKIMPSLLLQVEPDFWPTRWHTAPPANFQQKGTGPEQQDAGPTVRAKRPRRSVGSKTPVRTPRRSFGAKGDGHLGYGARPHLDAGGVREKAENVPRARAVLLHRERCNGLAAMGQYSDAIERELAA